MRLPRIALCGIVVLCSCGQSVDRVQVIPDKGRPEMFSPWVGINKPLQDQLNQVKWLQTMAWNQVVEEAEAAEEVPAPGSGPTASSTSVDWPCVARVETGSDWTMTGETYSTAYGMINGIIYEYASPEVQQRVFSGTATPEEQTDIAARFAADNGTSGWGERTKQICGL